MKRQYIKKEIIGKERKGMEREQKREGGAKKRTQLGKATGEKATGR